MALPDNYIKARIVYKTPDRLAMINVLWYHLNDTAVASAADAIAWAALIENDINGPLKACLTTNSSYVATVVQLNVGGVVFEGASDAHAGVGTVVADELPSYCAVVIQKRTVAAGAQGRGRWYIGGVPETFANEGVVTPAALLLYDALAGAFILPQAIVPTTATPCHFSPNDEILYSITTISTNTLLGTQRRRRLRPPF